MAKMKMKKMHKKNEVTYMIFDFILNFFEIFLIKHQDFSKIFPNISKITFKNPLFENIQNI